MLWFIFFLVAIVIILVAYLIKTYNSLVSSCVRVDNSWSQIDVQLKKRFDLVPNLVKTVKSYASFEKETLESVIKYRNAGQNAKTVDEKIANSNELTKSINNLLLTVEAYPDLKSNTSFLELQRELKDLETKIAVSRQFYNDTVMIYNEKIVKFPSNIISSILGYSQRPYFAAEEGVDKAPNIEF